MGDSDLSGTDAAMGGTSHADIAGGYRFFNTDTNQRATGNGGQGIAISNVVDDFDCKLRDVIRYDTPVWQGIQLSASHGGRSNDTYAFAVRYGAKLYGTQLVTAAGYTASKTHTTDTAQNGTSTTDHKQYNASLGLLHSSGLNFYLAGGRRDHSNSDIKKGSIWTAKVGYQADLCKWGKTSFAVDYGEFKDLFATRNIPNDKFKVKVFGAAVVQSIDRISTDVYLGFKRYLLEANTLNDNGTEVNGNYKGITAFLAGARIKF